MELFDESKFENELKIPYSIEAEEALLGSIFIKPDAISEIIEVITPTDFYKNNYRIIFEEMLKAYNMGKIIDTLLIVEALKKLEKLEEIGGEDIIYDLVDVVSTAANAVNYAHVIKEKSIQRQLIETGENITRMAYRGYDEVDAMLDKAESMIFKIAEGKQKKDVVSLNELAGMKISSLDEMSKYKGGIRGISSGFAKYDELTSGFHGSDLIILAARPAMGKTAFALNLALNVAKSGKHVLVYSLEMGNEQLFDRLLSIESKIKLSAIKDGTLKDSDYTDLGNGMGRLAELPLYISDSSSVNILEIKAVARRLKAEGKLDFMMIDYLQLINPTAGSKKSREQEISEISRSLKIIAKELNIPISYKTTGKEREFKEYIENDEVNQLYFLDIDIHGVEKKGFEVAQFIRHHNPYAIIVFITSRSEFATLTYKYQVSALDFVDKDINDELFKKRIEQSILYTKNMLLENKDVVDYFDYNYKGNDLKIPYHDILYIETTGVSHKLRIIGKNFAKEFYGTMADIQEKDKDTQRFYSAHKSFLVNVGNIREIDRKNLEVVFYEDHRCPITRLKVRKLRDILEKKSKK